MMIWDWKDSSVGRVFDQHTGNPGWGQFPGLPKKGHVVHICNPRIQEMKTGRPEIILDYSEQGLAQDECLSENTYSIKRNMKQAILQEVKILKVTSLHLLLFCFRPLGLQNKVFLPHLSSLRSERLNKEGALKQGNIRTLSSFFVLYCSPCYAWD